MRIIRIPTLTGYVPPEGLRVKCAWLLKDGSYEVVLEPVGFLRTASRYRTGPTCSVPALIVGHATCTLSTSEVDRKGRL